MTGGATSHESIFLSWDPPLFEEQNGVITGYTVNVTNLRREETLQFTVIDSQNLSIGSLLPHTTYACIVAAHTMVGAGPFSPQLLIRTLETSKCCLLQKVRLFRNAAQCEGQTTLMLNTGMRLLAKKYDEERVESSNFAFLVTCSTTIVIFPSLSVCLPVSVLLPDLFDHHRYCSNYLHPCGIQLS